MPETSTQNSTNLRRPGTPAEQRRRPRPEHHDLDDHWSVTAGEPELASA